MKRVLEKNNVEVIDNPKFDPNENPTRKERDLDPKYKANQSILKKKRLEEKQQESM